MKIQLKEEQPYSCRHICFNIVLSPRAIVPWKFYPPHHHHFNLIPTTTCDEQECIRSAVYRYPVERTY